MSKIMSRKIKEYIDIANSQLKGEKLNSINEEQENATELAKNGLNKILDQGIQLAELEDKSISLREHAFMFEDSAKHQKNKYKYQRFKMLMILVGGTFVMGSVLYFLGYNMAPIIKNCQIISNFVCGDVADQFAKGNANFSNVKNIKDCGEKCKQDSKCIGYEYDASRAICYLNYGCPNGPMVNNMQYCYLNEVKWN